VTFGVLGFLGEVREEVGKEAGDGGKLTETKRA
jgi:hypothetical protein